MQTIEFLGDGEDQAGNCLPGTYHCDTYAGMDFTLCGISTDGDTGTIGSCRYTDNKINCLECLSIILFCKKIPNKSLDRTPVLAGFQTLGVALLTKMRLDGLLVNVSATGAGDLSIRHLRR